jgi:hypothetical protein
MKHALTPREPVFTRKIRNIILGPNSCIAPGFFPVSVGLVLVGVLRVLNVLQKIMNTLPGLLVNLCGYNC